LDEQFQLDASAAEPGTVVLRVIGELDTLTADQLPQTVAAQPSPVTRCVVDLGECTFIDSSGIRGLLLCQRELAAGGVLELINVNAKLERTLTIAGVGEVLRIASAE
jgi:anti-anti-sigma factor